MNLSLSMNSTFHEWVVFAAYGVPSALVFVGIILVLRHFQLPVLWLFKMLVSVPIFFLCIKVAASMGLLGVLMIVGLGFVLAFIWAPDLAAAVCSPLTNMLDGGGVAPELKASYSIALAHRKRGRYPEAIQAVRGQLERHPMDFEGVLLLAGIQAENLWDLPGAENTLSHFCNNPKAPPNQVAAAWNAMADWHLKVGKDTDSARDSLQRIINSFPQSELALRAEQRLAHLVETEGVLLGQMSDTPYLLAPGVQDIGLLDSSAFLKPKEESPVQRVSKFVQHLDQHPHDSEAREKLALVYGRELGRLDLATIELRHLIDEKRHSPKQIAGWLDLLATLQIEGGANVATVRATLQEIVDSFPSLPLADATRRRLVRIDSEIKKKETKPAEIKIGNYEQNIGLKYGNPRYGTPDGTGG